MGKIILPKLSYKLMGILFDVHNELGPSLLEKYYQRAVEKGLKAKRLHFNKEFPVEIVYRGDSIGRYFLDFLIEDLIILETKAQSFSPVFFKQTLAYLKQTNLPLAIIANFRGERLNYRRVVNPSFKDVDLSKRDDKF